MAHSGQNVLSGFGPLTQMETPTFLFHCTDNEKWMSNEITWLHDLSSLLLLSPSYSLSAAIRDVECVFNYKYKRSFFGVYTISQ